jgi:polyphosphate kinase
VLDQAKHRDRSIFERLKFLSITASNLDEFCTIRLGSLYNYLDYGKERYDYSGLRETPFRQLLLTEIQAFVRNQNEYYIKKLKPQFEKNGFNIVNCESLSIEQGTQVDQYFNRTIYPMLTPMLFDNYHTFPVLKYNRLLFGVVTRMPQDINNQERYSFIQVPSNLPRFYEIENGNESISFVPIEDIIRRNMQHLFRNVDIAAINLFRIIRNGDFTLKRVKILRQTS